MALRISHLYSSTFFSSCAIIASFTLSS